jgi:hypothetical protein
MSEPSASPVPYKVVYSERVRDELKKLMAKAAAAGLGQQALDALKQIDHRLRVYPQFGEPLRDMQTVGETLWAGTVTPLVVEYVIDNERRSVFVVAPLKALPKAGF